MFGVQIEASFEKNHPCQAAPEVLELLHGRLGGRRSWGVLEWME